MSTGRRLAVVVVRESLKSEARTRKRAVWVRAEMGMLRCCMEEAEDEERKLSSQVGETARDLVLSS